MTRARRHDGQRGAAAVEFALITPVLLLLLFGIIEWSLAYKDSLTVASATRTGVRTASAEPRNAAMPADTARVVARAVANLRDGAVTALWVYKADKDGKPDSGGFTTCSTNCISFTWDEATNSFKNPVGSWLATSQDACAGESHAVGVYLKVRHQFLSGFFPGDLTLTDHTVMNLEPIPVFQGCK